MAIPNTTNYCIYFLHNYYDLYTRTFNMLHYQKKIKWCYLTITRQKKTLLVTACKIKPLVLLKFESSYFSFKFVLGLQFSALVSRPSFARKPLALIVLRLQSKSQNRKIHLKFGIINLTNNRNFICYFFSSSHFDSWQKIKMVFAALTFLVVVF